MSEEDEFHDFANAFFVVDYEDEFAIAGDGRSNGSNRSGRRINRFGW
jgi:hypothetical protein